ncbi:MAG: hypothetical protein ACLFPU_09960, partial [Dehalococcoidia bacterium]
KVDPAEITLVTGLMPHTTPDTKQETKSLLELDTSLESWGTPCITRLASLMGRPIPATREEKARLISEAKAYAEDQA